MRFRTPCPVVGLRLPHTPFPLAVWVVVRERRTGGTCSHEAGACAGFSVTYIDWKIRMVLQSWREKQTRMYTHTRTHTYSDGEVSSYLNISKTKRVIKNQNKSELLRMALNRLSVWIVPSLSIKKAAGVFSLHFPVTRSLCLRMLV